MFTTWTRSLFAAALMVGFATTACGGPDSSPPDPASGSGGTQATGGSGGSDDGQMPDDAVLATCNDDGICTCPTGKALMPEKQYPPYCSAQPSVIEADASETGGSGGSPEEPDATTTVPDAEPPCPDLDGRLCPNRGNCTIQAVEGRICSFHCVNGDGSENFGATDGAENSQRLFAFCGMTH